MRTTGHPLSELLSYLETEFGSCELTQILSAARFLPLGDANVLGLHPFRCTLAERMYYARIHANGLASHPDFETWQRDGVVLKNFEEMDDEQISSLLDMVAARASSTETIPKPPFKWTPRNITVPEVRDLQTFGHVDTFATAVKIWIFDGSVEPKHGPLTYAKGSHRNSVPKMKWMYDYSLPPAAEALQEPSFRLFGSATATERNPNFISEIAANSTPVLPLHVQRGQSDSTFFLSWGRKNLLSFKRISALDNS